MWAWVTDLLLNLPLNMITPISLITPSNPILYCKFLARSSWVIQRMYH